VGAEVARRRYNVSCVLFCFLLCGGNIGGKMV
jgi:hypothetical protein